MVPQKVLTSWRKKIDKFGISEEPWFCWSCRKDNIPFQTLCLLQIQKLFAISKKRQNQNDEKICCCKICNKKINHSENSLTSDFCKYVTNKKCAIQKAANKLFAMNFSLTCFLLQIFKIMIYWT